MRNIGLATLGMLAAVTMVPDDGEAQRGRRGAVGIAATLARPVGEFQHFVDWGGGLSVYGLVNFDRGGHVGLRMDGSYVLYGHERFAAPLSPSVGRVFVDVRTENFIASFGVGPQFTLGSGPVRPYVFGTAGFSYFGTVSSVRGTADFHDFASSTNFDDLTPALTAGGGLLLRVSRGRHPVSVDMSVQSTYNGEADYLTEGDVVEERDGSLTLYPIRSEANLMTFRFGIAVGL